MNTWWWQKLQFAYFDYFPVYYFVQVHSICLSLLFKTHSLVDYECRLLRYFICMFCRSLFVLLYFFPIVVSVLLRYTDSDCPFGIFKLFLAKSWNIQLFSVLAVVYANDGWKKLQFAYFYYFPVYYFVQVHSIWGSCYSIFSFICMFCRSLFVLLYFFPPLCCLFFVDIRILIAPLVSSNSSLT
jgi:hypothetical protein